MTSFVWLVVVLSLCLHETQAGFRILGFRRDRMTENSKELLNREYFLTDENLGEGEEWTKLCEYLNSSLQGLSLVGNRNAEVFVLVLIQTKPCEDVNIGWKNT